MTKLLAIGGPENGYYIDADTARSLGYVEYTWPSGEVVYAEESVLAEQAEVTDDQ